MPSNDDSRPIAPAASAPAGHASVGIDTLRAIAVLCVVAHHIFAYTSFEVPYLDKNGGVIGVQLFFLISGYLILQSAFKYSLRDFAIHRFFRIFPPYLAVLLSITAVKYLFMDSFRAVFDGFWPFFLLNIANLQLLYPVSVLFLDATHVGWSLTVELCWYALAPLLALGLRSNRHRNATLIVVLLLSVALSMLWVYASQHQWLDGLYREGFARIHLNIQDPFFRHALIDNAPPAQLMYFFIGAALWVFKDRLHRVSTAVLSVVMLSVLWFIPSWNAMMGLYPNVLTGIGCAALFVWVCRFGIGDALTQWLSKVSYSIYLIHAPILIVCAKLIPSLGLALSLTVALATTAVGAELSWRWIEAPFQRLGKRLCRP